MAHMRITIEANDKDCDPDWLECILQDIWDMIRIARRKSGPKRQAYELLFGAQKVMLTIEKASNGQQ